MVIYGAVQACGGHLGMPLSMSLRFEGARVFGNLRRDTDDDGWAGRSPVLNGFVKRQAFRKWLSPGMSIENPEAPGSFAS